MHKTIKVLGIGVIALVALAALGAGVAFAQSSIPTPDSALGWMMGGRGSRMGGFAQDGEQWEWMNAMHQWMSSGGGMHTFIWDALADELGLTSDELTAAVSGGKTLAEIADEQGLSRPELISVLETAHQEALAQGVAGGYLTQEQADSILTQMAGRYELMLDQAGFGGYGGMMGSFARPGSAGQFVPGGCHGSWNSSLEAPQTNP